MTLKDLILTAYQYGKINDLTGLRECQKKGEEMEIDLGKRFCTTHKQKHGLYNPSCHIITTEKDYELLFCGLNPYCQNILSDHDQRLKTAYKRGVEDGVRELIICPSCNGSGRADTMQGASECQNCGGDGHVFSEEAGILINDVIQELKNKLKVEGKE
jgi:hypothetical protein